jgi:hypothetical protein
MWRSPDLLMRRAARQASGGTPTSQNRHGSCSSKTSGNRGPSGPSQHEDKSMVH